MEATENPIKTIASKVVYENRWITVREDTTKLLSGKDGIYGYVESNNSVMVAALNDQNQVYLVKAFRYPTQSWGWELPGGSGEGEELLAASKRELEEETGIVASNWELAGTTLVCNGLMTERMATCIASGLHFEGNKEDSDEKFADMRFFDFDEIDHLIDTGEIDDGQTITGLFFAKRWLERKAAE